MPPRRNCLSQNWKSRLSRKRDSAHGRPRHITFRPVKRCRKCLKRRRPEYSRFCPITTSYSRRSKQEPSNTENQKHNKMEITEQQYDAVINGIRVQHEIFRQKMEDKDRDMRILRESAKLDDELIRQLEGQADALEVDIGDLKIEDRKSTRLNSS